MKLSDVRRLTGANLIMDSPGAGGEVTLPEGREGLVIALWRRHLHEVLSAIGWDRERVGVRMFPGGAGLAISAPLDALHAACDVIEWSWESTCASLSGESAPDLNVVAEKLRKKIAEESNPRLLQLAGAARERHLTFLHGEDQVSLGLGSGGRCWPEHEIPPIEEIPWDSLYDIPVALVTGTNGKSTSVRLAAAMGAAAGRTVAVCSSDWVRVGNEIVEEGDYSGPGGARMGVRDPRADLAVLEVARGGLMRRGLSIPRAGAALITNVAADHLGSTASVTSQA